MNRSIPGVIIILMVNLLISTTLRAEIKLPAIIGDYMVLQQQTEAAITTPDILPSLLSLCNIDIPNTIEGYDLSYIIKFLNKDSDRVALYMHLVPFESMYGIDEYRAVRTNKYTYVKTPQDASMLFDNEEDPYQMNNLVNQPKYADIQEKQDEQLMNELHRIGEEKIEERDYYFKKFGYYGQKEFSSRLPHCRLHYRGGCCFTQKVD